MKDPFLASMERNEELKQKELEEKLAKIDFSKPLSVDDYIYVSEHFDEFWKVANVEQKKRHIEDTFEGFDSPESKVVINILKIIAEEQVTNPDIDYIDINKFNLNQEEKQIAKKQGIIKSSKLSVQESLTYIRKISDLKRELIIKIKHDIDSSTIKNLSVDEVIAKYKFSDEDKKCIKDFHVTSDKFICDRVAEVIKSCYQEIPQELAELCEKCEQRSAAESKKIENVEQSNSNLVSDIQEVPTYEDNRAIDIDIFFDEAFDNPENEFYAEPAIEEVELFESEVQLQDDSNQSQLSSEKNKYGEQLEYLDDEKIGLVQNEDEIDKETLDNVKSEQSVFDLQEEYETLEFEAKKSLIEKMQESKNPFARAISKGLMAFSGRKQKSLPASQMQQEAASTQQAFDNEDLEASNANKNARMDITDRALIPAGKGIRNTLIGIGEGFMNGIGNLFKGNKNNNEQVQEVATIKPVTPTNTFDTKYAVQLNNGQGPIIPSVKTAQTVRNSANVINAGKDNRVAHDYEDDSTR